MSSSLLSGAFRPSNQSHKLLDLNSVKEVPDSHAWTSILDEHPFVDGCNVESVPVIDLNNKNAMKLIDHACTTWGVFQVVNHNIPKKLFEDVEWAGKKLFSLPMKQKLKAARSSDSIAGYGAVPISYLFPKQIWSEGFTIVGSPVDHAHQLWPQDFQNFCDTIEEYQNEMKTLAGKLMWLMLGSLGITKDDVKWADENEEGGCAAVLQLNSYPVCPDPDRAMGLGPHTDSTILSILHQNNASGLQVLRDGCGWVTVPPLPGALVILGGDLLQILSNGLYTNVRHRAVVNRSQHRMSIVYLCGPPSNVKISPLPKLVDYFHPPLYRPITWSEYLGTKAKHFDKALTLVRLGDKNDQN